MRLVGVSGFVQDNDSTMSVQMLDEYTMCTRPHGDGHRNNY